MLANFRSQARVVDLLGREQIADSPTAIGELFKNALDAGASQAWVDWNEEADLLTIRDNGLGMRPKDVTDKWLVLATDSSHRSDDENEEWAKHANSEQIQWLSQQRYGEKGIGRLSVAILGRLVLLWTVWGKGDDKTGTLCIVHWNLFRHPRKLFEDLPIPVYDFDKPPTWKTIKSLLSDYHSQLADEKKSEKEEQTTPPPILKDETWSLLYREEITNDLQAASILPKDDKETLSWETGTTFFLQGLTEHVPELFDKANRELPAEEEFSSDYLKAYHAFQTFWDPFHDNHDGRDFKIHATRNGKPLLEDNRFWEPQDFAQCDHHIRIEVDEAGFAKGIIKNYQKSPFPYQKQLKHLPKYSTSPGKFLVEIGYLQGDRSVSSLPDDIFNSVRDRLEHAGGFSIYLNHVRIQPYGSIDSDFAGFEYRRLKNAGRYYFASRRMFGGVFLPSFSETKLREKAGREGFIKNGSSRGLRFWLEDLFTDLADSHFGRKSDRSDKKESKQKNKNKQQAKERLQTQKKEYLSEISKAGKNFKKFTESVQRQIKNIKQLIGSEANAEPGTYLKSLEEEVQTLGDLLLLLAETPAEPPTGVVLSDKESDRVDSYISQRSSLRNNLTRRVTFYSQKLEDASKRRRTRQEHIKWLEKKFITVDTVYKERIAELVNPLKEQQEQIKLKIEKVATDSKEELSDIFDQSIGELTPLAVASDTTDKSAKKLEEALQLVEQHYQDNTKKNITEIAEEIKHLLEGSSSIVLVQEFAAEINRLKEREAFLIEMAQLGLITEAATHEHEHHVHNVRNQIKHLQKHISPNHRNQLSQLSASFDIIDSRMRMFDPLIRRKGVITPELSGKTIAEFLTQHFSKYIGKNHIKIHPSFDDLILTSVKKPIILGAVHNIVHNAIYWSSKGDYGQRPRILLTATPDRLVISDNGPGIAPVDLERIYDPGFSRRPYGRGFGLYIAKQALNAIGYDLLCITEQEDTILAGANFVITQIPKE